MLFSRCRYWIQLVVRVKVCIATLAKWLPRETRILQGSLFCWHLLVRGAMALLEPGLKLNWLFWSAVFPEIHAPWIWKRSNLHLRILLFGWNRLDLVLLEHLGTSIIVDMDSSPQRVSALLPASFLLVTDTQTFMQMAFPSEKGEWHRTSALPICVSGVSKKSSNVVVTNKNRTKERIRN